MTPPSFPASNEEIGEDQPRASFHPTIRFYRLNGQEVVKPPPNNAELKYRLAAMQLVMAAVWYKSDVSRFGDNLSFGDRAAILADILYRTTGCSRQDALTCAEGALEGEPE